MHTHIYFVTTKKGANIDPHGCQQLQFKIGRYEGDIQDIKPDEQFNVKPYPLFSADVHDMTEIENIELANDCAELGLAGQEDNVLCDIEDLARNAVEALLILQMQNHDKLCQQNQISLTEMLEVFTVNKTMAFSYDLIGEDNKLVKRDTLNLQNQLKLDYNQNHVSTMQ